MCSYVALVAKKSCVAVDRVGQAIGLCDECVTRFIRVCRWSAGIRAVEAMLVGMKYVVYYILRVSNSLGGTEI